jgi:hypothetical protein
MADFWQPATAPSGKQYYWNLKTKATVWDRPHGVGVVIVDPAQAKAAAVGAIIEAPHKLSPPQFNILFCFTTDPSSLGHICSLVLPNPPMQPNMVVPLARLCGHPLQNFLIPCTCRLSIRSLGASSGQGDGDQSATESFASPCDWTYCTCVQAPTSRKAPPCLILRCF